MIESTTKETAISAGNNQELVAETTIQMVSGTDSSIQSGTNTVFNAANNLEFENKGNVFAVTSSDLMSIDASSSISWNTNEKFAFSASNDLRVTTPSTKSLKSGGDLNIDTENAMSILANGNVNMEDKGTFTLKAKGNAKLTANTGSAVLNSIKDLKIKSGNKVDLQASALSIRSGSTLNARVGTDMNLNGNDIKFTTGGSTNPLYLASNGRLSLGQLTGDARLNVNGAMAVSGTTTAREYVSPSDARLKQEVTPLNISMGIFQKLKTVKYDWNKLAVETGLVKNKTTSEIGLIAQDVEELYPELIHEMNVFNDTMSIKTVDYSRLNTILIEVLKDNQKYILSLQERVRELKKKYLQKLKQKMLRQQKASTAREATEK
jgi:uncharacterized protein (DUF2345 family)